MTSSVLMCCGEADGCLAVAPDGSSLVEVSEQTPEVSNQVLPCYIEAVCLEIVDHKYRVTETLSENSAQSLSRLLAVRVAEVTCSGCVHCLHCSHINHVQPGDTSPIYIDRVLDVYESIVSRHSTLCRDSERGGEMSPPDVNEERVHVALLKFGCSATPDGVTWYRGWLLNWTRHTLCHLPVTKSELTGLVMYVVRLQLFVQFVLGR